MKKKVNPASGLDEIPGEKLWKYAFWLYLQHYEHGLGYLALVLKVVFTVIGACGTFYALVLMEMHALSAGHVVLTAGCFVLAIVARQVYKGLRRKASFFASDCVDFGNKTYDDARSYFCSLTGQELKA